MAVFSHLQFVIQGFLKSLKLTVAMTNWWLMFTVTRTDQSESWIVSRCCVVMYFIVLRYTESAFCGLVFLKQRVGNLLWASETHCWDLHFPHKKKNAAVVLVMEIIRTGCIQVVTWKWRVVIGEKESWERSSLDHSVNIAKTYVWFWVI